MLAFAANNSDVNFDQLRSILGDLKVLADKIKTIYLSQNRIDMWLDFLNTDLVAYFVNDSATYNKISEELTKQTPFNYYEQHFKPFYKLASNIYDRKFYFDLPTTDNIDNVIKLIIEDTSFDQK